MSDVSPPAGGARFSPLRFVPFVVLVAGLIAFFALGFDRFVRFDTLSAHREDLVAWVAAHYVWAALVYVAGYIGMVAFSVPGAALATMLGGFLFGTAKAVAFVLIGATVGASLVFLAARTAFADILHAKAGRALMRMEQGFRDNALSYLLFLRLVPIFPFFLVNLVPAFLGVSLRTFVIGTFVGIIPGVFLYARVGGGIGELLDAGSAPNLYMVLEPRFLLPLVALGVLALLPVLYKAFRARKS